MAELEKVTVRLGERDFEVAAAGFARARVWKQRLINEVQPIFATLADAPGIQFETPADLLKLLPLAETLIVGGVGTIFELLIDYAPTLAAERGYIEEHASDKQIVAAFQEVVGLADPFGVVALLNLRLGRGVNGTSASLPSANGISASTRPTRSQKGK